MEKARREFPKVPFARLLGMEMVSLAPGEAVLKLALRDELRQTHGVLHGGATASLIDTAMAFAIISILEADERATTIDLTVHYLRPVSAGEIVCTAKVARRAANSDRFGGMRGRGRQNDSDGAFNLHEILTTGAFIAQITG